VLWLHKTNLQTAFNLLRETNQSKTSDISKRPVYLCEVPSESFQWVRQRNSNKGSYMTARTFSSRRFDTTTTSECLLITINLFWRARSLRVKRPVLKSNILTCQSTCHCFEGQRVNAISLFWRARAYVAQSTCFEEQDLYASIDLFCFQKQELT
jgi:hypothetical protein